MPIDVWGIEISSEEPNAWLICDKVDGADGLLVVGFRKGWNSVYPNYSKKVRRVGFWQEPNSTKEESILKSREKRRTKGLDLA